MDRKTEKVVEFFNRNCSFQSQVIEKIPKSRRIIVKFILCVFFMLIIFCLIQSFIHPTQLRFLFLFLFFIFSPFGLLWWYQGLRDKQLVVFFQKNGISVRTINEIRQLGQNGGPGFEDISYEKFKIALKSKDFKLYERIKLNELKGILNLKAKGLTLDLFKFAAIAAVVIGPIWAGYVGTFFFYSW